MWKYKNGIWLCVEGKECLKVGVALRKYDKIVLQQFLNNEEAVIKRLTQVYNQSLKDVTAKSKELYDEIEELTSVYDDVEDEAEKAVLKSRIQSKVYQKQYQDSLKKQVSDILDNMHENSYTTVADYLNTCYVDGFVGALYSIQQQGIPLAFPLDQESMVRAVQLDSKISTSMYTHLGEDVAKLKKHITAQVSRGIASNMPFAQVAQQLSTKMVGQYKNPGGSLYNAMRIARTEGHRIQCQAGDDACINAKARGADIVRQWESTLDGRTRDSHARVDGEIREVGEKFSNGLMFPGDPSGAAAEVIHCRCALLQRARWALGSGFTKMNNFTKQLETFDSPEDYAEFKKEFFSKENTQYMNYVQKMEERYKTKDWHKILDTMTDKDYDEYSLLTCKNPIFNKKGIEFFDKSDTIRLGVVRDAITSGNVSLKIKSRQNLHVKGHKDFKEGRSYFEPDTDIAKLVDELKGTGEPIFDADGDWTNKERVVASSFVGIHVDGETGKETPTRNLTIIYSKDGCHVVPGRSKNQ